MSQDSRIGSLLILFGGSRREPIVERVVAEGFKVEAIVVPGAPNPRLKASIEALRGLGPEIVPCGRSEVASTLARFGHCVLLSIGFPYLLPADVLDGFRCALNVHPTLLPRYRGPFSGAYILMNGERESGSTVHVIDAGMDTGPIVAQRRVALTPFDTPRSMQRKVYAVEPDLVVEALRRLVEPGFVPGPQDETHATSYPRRRVPADSEIDPSQPLNRLFDRIRACDAEDYPAFFFVDGQKVCVRLWRPDKPPDEADLI